MPDDRNKQQGPQGQHAGGNDQQDGGQQMRGRNPQDDKSTGGQQLGGQDRKGGPDGGSYKESGQNEQTQR